MRSRRPRTSCPRRAARSSWPAEASLWAGAAQAIEDLARRLDAPIITTLNGKGLIDERNPLSLGHGRSVRAKAVLPHADVMLADRLPIHRGLHRLATTADPGPVDPDRPRPRRRSA